MYSSQNFDQHFHEKWASVILINLNLTKKKCVCKCFVHAYFSIPFTWIRHCRPALRPHFPLAIRAPGFPRTGPFTAHNRRNISRQGSIGQTRLIRGLVKRVQKTSRFQTLTGSVPDPFGRKSDGKECFQIEQAASKFASRPPVFYISKGLENWGNVPGRGANESKNLFYFVRKNLKKNL